MKRKTRAFTLVEVMVVIAILSMLIAVVVPAVDSYFSISKRYRAKTHGGELYSAASAAVDNTFSLHGTEFAESLTKSASYQEAGTGDTAKLEFGYITNEYLSGVQFTSGNGRTFNYAEGFRQVYVKNGGKQKGAAYMSKYMLQNLNALATDIKAVDERLIFASKQNPVSPSGGKGSTVTAYNGTVSNTSYNAGGAGRKCAQAGVVVCYGRSNEGAGEVLYTEYGDADGYLVICVNPKWYYFLKDKLSEVKKYDSDLTDDKRKALAARGESNPIVIISENGVYEAMY